MAVFIRSVMGELICVAFTVNVIWLHSTSSGGLSGGKRMSSNPSGL